ncbi:hypothetical protein GCM10027570_05730 [Streptomonospora sediminis]
MPLHDADPRQLGPFRLSDRAGSGAEGVVYLARDSRGRQVSVAMLSEGASADPAARDRFTAAVRSGTGVADPPKVLAFSLSGRTASWVAVRGGGARGAEAYLEPVAIAGAGSGSAAGAPSYAPHWTGRGATAPASASWAPAAWPWAPAGVRRRAGAKAGTSWPVVITLLVALLLFAVLVVMIFLLLQSYSVQAGRPPAQQPQYSPGGSPPPNSSPSPDETGEPTPGQEGTSRPTAQPTSQPTSGPTPSGGVPTVDLDEEDYPPGVPLDPEDQA